MKCSVTDCSLSVRAGGLCTGHYQRWRKSGSTDGPPVRRVRIGVDPIERMREQSERVGDCLVFTGAKMKAGYGIINIARRSRLVHHVAAERFIGPRPAGMEVMHSCDNPPCWEPAHLSYGTHGENVSDMHAKGRAAGQQRGGRKPRVA